MKQQKDSLILIPKYQAYMQYIIEIIFKIPRTEKFNIGNEYKQSMYQTLENILIISKLEKEKCLEYINRIDASLNVQRILLRIMYQNHWIDAKKFNVAIDKIYEIGKIVGGLLKYYGKNNKELVYKGIHISKAKCEIEISNKSKKEIIG